MDLWTCEVRFEADESRQSPGRLAGVLLTYGERASDRAEVFDAGALRFPDGGLWINEQHNRAAPILRALPTLDGQALKIDAAFPDTARARDAVTGLKSDPPLYTGLSIEFHAERETRRGGLRHIQSAYAPRAALVDVPSYSGSVVEVREQGGPYWMLNRESLRWL